MKPEIAIVIGPLIFLAVIVQFMPLLTRRGIFFGATVDPAFPQSRDGRRLLRSYRRQAALWGALAIALAALLTRQNAAVAILAPMFALLIAAGLSYWLKFREVHARYGVRRPEIREASLSSVPEKETISLWLLVPPLLAIPAVALYLHLHWNQIPATFPVHWGADGQPNRWASRDPLGVYGSLLIASLVNLFILGLAWMLSRLSRKTVMRYVTVRLLELLLYPLTFVFVMVSLLPLMRIPMWLIPAPILVFVLGVMYWGYLKISAPSARDEVPEPQNDSYWKAGAFYYNPNDPAIFVSKRVGIGYTMNFANKWSWVAIGAIILAIAASIYFGGKATS
ncbi:MAG: DUF5808 domain-containing protein [Candidatus Korobacteraceae bacterium]|jgi:uncharacterized membrane protein